MASSSNEATRYWSLEPTLTTAAAVWIWPLAC